MILEQTIRSDDNISLSYRCIYDHICIITNTESSAKACPAWHNGYNMMNMVIPEYLLENVVDDQITLSDNNQQSHVSPGKERELLHVVAFNQWEDKPDKADDVEWKRNEAMVFNHATQEFLEKNDILDYYTEEKWNVKDLSTVLVSTTPK